VGSNNTNQESGLVNTHRVNLYIGHVGHIHRMTCGGCQPQQGKVQDAAP